MSVTSHKPMTVRWPGGEATIPGDWNDITWQQWRLMPKPPESGDKMLITSDYVTELVKYWLPHCDVTSMPYESKSAVGVKDLGDHLCRFLLMPESMPLIPEFTLDGHTFACVADKLTEGGNRMIMGEATWGQFTDIEGILYSLKAERIDEQDWPYAMAVAYECEGLDLAARRGVLEYAPMDAVLGFNFFLLRWVNGCGDRMAHYLPRLAANLKSLHDSSLSVVR